MPDEEVPFYENSHERRRAVNCVDALTLIIFAKIKNIAETVKALLRHPACLSAADGVDTGEMAANLKLAYRHLEDAGMRLGKAIQAFDGGKSIYDDRDRARLK